MHETAQTPSGPQRLRALEQANAIRLARAELKRQIAVGDASVADVILNCPESARKWTISELLMAQRRWGITRCRKFLDRNGISEIKAIGALTERQRLMLAEQLQELALQMERPRPVTRATITEPRRQPELVRQGEQRRQLAYV
jgi:hypothetical protein